MVVDAKALAEELRRRHIGQRGLRDALHQSSGSTWLPGELGQVPSGLLVLAAVSLAGPRRG